MIHRYLQLSSTSSVKAARARYGSAVQYAKLDGTHGSEGPVRNDRLGADEAAFIAARDGFYLASVSEDGWPYVQFRGGPPGFLRVLDERTLGYADFRGNRQYITVGNVAADDRVSLLLMDYAQRRRLKIMGHLEFRDAREDPALAARLGVQGYRAPVERTASIRVEAFDWNCKQHITPRFTEAEIESLLAQRADRTGPPGIERP